MTKPDLRKTTNKYAKYSGLGMQLIALLFLCIWLGKKLDARWGGENNYITAILLVTMLAAFFYKLYRELEKDRND